MKQIALFFPLSLIVCFFSLMTHAQVDPHIEWKTMHLPHFDLIYDAKHQELAKLYADRLEDNLKYLGQEFSELPSNTAVVINDRTDLTNGFATPIPYRLIMIYPVLPPMLTTISDYGDWARELTLHESTHILSFEPRRGVAKGLHAIFGSLITPNILLPRWFLEGVAVEMETRFSPYGRLRSSLQDGGLRAYVNDDRLFDVELGEINEVGIETWPQGARPYLFGSLMWSEMIAQYGNNLVQELHHRYGGRMPFFINGPVEDLTGNNYEQIFSQTLQDVAQRARKQLATLKTAAVPPEETLQIDNSLETFLPAISPDGLKMAVITKNDSNRRAVTILVRPDSHTPFRGEFAQRELHQRFNDDTGIIVPLPRQERDGPPTGTIQRLRWFADSQRFIFDRVDTPDLFHEVSDLWMMDLKNRKATQLTFGERAREADPSPDQKSVVFVGLGAGETTLKLLHLDTHQIEVLRQPPLQVRISNPSFWSDREVLFSERDTTGKETLWLMNLDNHEVAATLPDYPEIHDAHRTPLGLVFTSTLNGVNNAYLSSDLISAKPVSHSLTYVGAAEMDPVLHDLYLTELSSHGMQTRRVSEKDWRNIPSSLPHVGPLYADRYPAGSEPEVSAQKEYPTDDYSIWPYILPHYWFPNFSFSSSGDYLGFVTAGNDPLSKHVYALAGGYTTNDGHGAHYWDYNFQYLNHQTSAQIYFTSYDIHTWVTTSDDTYRDREHDLYALWTIPGFSSELFAGAGWTWQSRNYIHTVTDSTYQTGPSLLVNYLDYVMSGRQFSPESGQAFSLKYTDFYPQGGNEDFRLLNFKMQKYFSTWLPAHNTIMLRLMGQWIDKDVSFPNYATTSSLQMYSNLPSPYYIMRGYPTGEFLGKSLANYSLEYRFPLKEINHGAGTTPLFIRQFHGAVVADGIQLDGDAINPKTSKYEPVSNSWKSFWDMGVEAKADVTLGYQFPFTLYAGVYWPLDSRYGNGNQFALGLQY
jgi:hypothetical protein